ncbi:MAG: TIGR03668 family PPOX class F420-dependent oxidoreductase [Blastocatellia bacterium]|nr:TIGR03668 family PPOX class F420-dependent oxidoreductase [Blastocatellia bacterium]
MALEIDDSTREFIRDHRIARLATADADAQPAVVPVCYAFDGANIYSPIDEKPKSVAAVRLKRVRNIEANGRVSLVIDDYSEDWSKLVYVIINGVADMIGPDAGEHARAVELLREKYPQYRSMRIENSLIVKITPLRIKRWSAQ